MTFLHLKTRSIIEISGEDRKKFLQGLVTNNVNKVSKENLIYAVMLNSMGRFLYDFFIFENEEKLILDCLESRRDEIVKKLSFYKLRSKVEIKKNDELKVFWSAERKDQQNLTFSDPRNSKMGFRTYSQNQETNLKEEDYDYLRISLKIPEEEKDLTYEKSFILEFGFDDLNAVDYNKGCYVGQEPTARIHHLGEIRKKIFHIEIDTKSLNQKVENYHDLKNGKITCEEKSVGIVLSSIFYENKLHALALIKIPENKDWEEKLEFNQNKILTIN